MLISLSVKFPCFSTYTDNINRRQWNDSAQVIQTPSSHPCQCTLQSFCVPFWDWNDDLPIEIAIIHHLLRFQTAIKEADLFISYALSMLTPHAISLINKHQAKSLWSTFFIIYTADHRNLQLYPKESRHRLIPLVMLVQLKAASSELKRLTEAEAPH